MTLSFSAPGFSGFSRPLLRKGSIRGDQLQGKSLRFLAGDGATFRWQHELKALGAAAHWQGPGEGASAGSRWLTALETQLSQLKVRLEALRARTGSGGQGDNGLGGSNGDGAGGGDTVIQPPPPSQGPPVPGPGGPNRVPGRVIQGTNRADKLLGGAGDDTFVPGRGNDDVDGGAGFNTVRFTGSVLDYTIERRGQSVARVVDKRPNRDGDNQVRRVQQLAFHDRTVYLQNGVNNAPIGRPNQFTLRHDQELRIPVAHLTGNDIDFDGDALTVDSVRRATLNGGVVIYRPPTQIQWALTERNELEHSFSYQASDGKGGVYTQIATVTILGPGHSGTPSRQAAPVTGQPAPGRPQSGGGESGAPAYSLWTDATVPAVASDTETAPVELGVKFRASADGVVEGVRFYKGAQNTGTHTGSLWTATGQRLGSVIFTGETAGGWQTATFTNPIPITAGTTYVASYHAPMGGYAINTNYFSSGVTSGPLQALADGVQGGNGVYAYGPAGSFPTGSWNRSNYWVDVLFRPNEAVPNRPPVAQDDGGFVISAGGTLAIQGTQLLANDSDPDGDPLTIIGVSNAQGGIATLDAATGTVTFTAAPSYTGPASFRYKIADGQGNEASANVSLNVQDPGATYSLWNPSAVPAVANASDSDAVEVGVRFRASTDGVVEGVRFYKGAQNTGTHTGSLWTATGQRLGSVIFTNETASGWQTATFTNPIPITAGTTYIASYHAPVGRYSFSQNYFGSAVVNGPLEATSGSNGVFAYGPAGSFPTGSWNSTNYWVDVVFRPNAAAPNRPPVATDDSARTAENAPVTINVLANDSDPDGDTLSITGVDLTGTLGTATINANGTVVYDPGEAFTYLNSGETATDRFSYTVSDGRGGTATATVTVMIDGADSANRNPVAGPDSARTDENTPISINVLANDSDPDGDNLTVTSVDITDTLGTVTINPNNTISYDPTRAFQYLRAGETATDRFNYTISDGQGGTASAMVTVTIDGRDDAFNRIAEENARPGNPQSEWGINGHGDSSIEGFATDMSVNVGERVGFKINTEASAYRLDIYRFGYYGGMGARKVATVRPSVNNQRQPAPLTDPATGLVDAGNWAESASWEVPDDATSGVYFAKLVREDGVGGSNHIYFVVRDDSRPSDVVFQTADTTWQAYNTWGGSNLYSGNAPAGRAYKLSYNRPFGYAGHSVNRPVLDAEYPMIRWLEANGYDINYISGIDTDRFGSNLSNHKLFLSVGHDEYWTGQQRANVEAARDAGLNLAFFSGNEVYWKTRWENSIDGSNQPYRTLVSYKETWANSKIDPDPAWTGTWRDPRFSPPSDGGRPENELTGTIFTVDSYRLDTMTVSAEDGKMRLWRDTSIANLAPGQTATLTPNVLGYEWNEDLDNGFRPPGAINYSSTTLDVAQYVSNYGNTVGPGRATHQLTAYRAPNGGGIVFGAGTTRWSWGLDDNHINEPSTPDPRMQQATVNLFADMGVQPTTLKPGLKRATQSTDQTAPQSSIASPGTGMTIRAGDTVTISGTATDVGGRVGGVEVSTDGGTTWRKASGRDSWSYTWQPEAAGTFTIKSRATDDSLNTETPGSGKVITVGESPGPWSIWNASATPSVVTVDDPNGVELGVKFKPGRDGYIQGIRFYKGPMNTGIHTGSLWSATGEQLATVRFTNETARGWQQANFSSPVPVQAGTTYVASYYAPRGYYSASPGFFASAGAGNAHIRALSSPESGGNGVYAYGNSSRFPSSSYGSTNYWVDAVFTDTLAA